VNNAFLRSLFEHKLWANRGALSALASVPEDRRDATWVVALFTFDHSLIVDSIFKARLIGDEPPFDDVVARRTPTLDEMAETIDAVGAWYIDYARGVSQAELDETLHFKFISDDDDGVMTRADMLAHVITHSASHRGAVGEMLAKLPVKGAPDMVTSFVREVRARRPAATNPPAQREFGSLADQVTFDETFFDALPAAEREAWGED
jgi:uncharacterized damage-inducible protein DinB